MTLFDTRTVFLLCGVMGGLMALVLYSLKRNYPPSIKGLGDWSGGLLVLFGAGVMTAARDKLPDLITVSFANVLFFAGLYWGYVGTRRFFGAGMQHGRWLAMMALLVTVHLWFTYGHFSLFARLVLVNVMGAIFMGRHAVFIFSQRPLTSAKWLAGGALAGASLLQIMRVVMALVLPMDANIMATSPTHQIYAVGFAFSILLFSIGLILMATDMLRGELEQLATRDSLTNALTRRHWTTLFESELQRCNRTGRKMAVLALDLDHFKAVNDTYGHQTGDRVLIAFVANVNSYLRKNDCLGRFGGEEFSLLLPETPLEQALLVAERIRADLAQSSQLPSCTVSIGVTTNQSPTDTLDSILGRADAAMYRAKAAGRNRVEAG